MKPRPNILWIITDDTGYDMLGYSGGPPLTPNIDRLAHTGVVATRFHTASPICMPSRFSYLTGKYPGHCESSSFREKFPVTGHYKLAFDTPIDPGDHNNAAAIFKSAGYQTGFVGKYHVGPPMKQMGFHEYDPDEDPRNPVTRNKLQQDYSKMQDYLHGIGFTYADGISWDNTDNRPLVALRQHNMEWQTDHALRFLDAASGSSNPFFLYFATTPQHGPHQRTSIEGDPLITEWGFLERKPKVQRSRKSVLKRCSIYDKSEQHIACGAVWTDDAVGVLIDKLEKMGVLDDTIIIFSTDHGPGTRSGKFTCYQGGTQIPFLINCPALLPSGQECEALLQNIDLLPTLMALCGIPMSQSKFDGLNRLEQLNGAQDNREALYFELGNYRAVRTRGMKYITLRYGRRELEDMRCGRVSSAYLAVQGTGGDYPLRLYPNYFDPDQLYDLDRDPLEQNNLVDAPEYAEALAAMRQRLKEFLTEFDHPYPIDPDPFQTSNAFKELCEANFKDLSIFETDWYREHAW